MPRNTWIRVRGSVRSKGKGRGKSNVQGPEVRRRMLLGALPDYCRATTY